MKSKPTNQPTNHPGWKFHFLSLFLISILPGRSSGSGGWSGGAMVLGKLPVPGRPTIWITVGQGSTALAVGAGGGCLDIFSLIYPFFPLSPSLWETARYRLKYCLKAPLNPKQPTNQHLAVRSKHCPPILSSLRVLQYSSLYVQWVVGWCDGAG